MSSGWKEREERKGRKTRIPQQCIFFAFHYRFVLFAPLILNIGHTEKDRIMSHLISLLLVPLLFLSSCSSQSDLISKA